jgi:hypothetical protein
MFLRSFFLCVFDWYLLVHSTTAPDCLNILSPLMKDFNPVMLVQPCDTMWMPPNQIKSKPRFSDDP